MKEEARLARNVQRLGECFPPFAVVVRRIITSLEAQGFRPRIQDAWRSLEDQKKAKESGNSGVLFGFHNPTGAGGVKEALAVDLLDDDKPLASRKHYLIALAIAAQDNGVDTGILWNLKTAPRNAVKAAIAARNIHADVALGGDPTHIEPVGITIAQAKKGVRPTFAGMPGPAPVVVTPPVSTSGKIHVVVSGDTLGAIAKKHGLTLARILELNPAKKANPNLIKVGEKILVG